MPVHTLEQGSYITELNRDGEHRWIERLLEARARGEEHQDVRRLSKFDLSASSGDPTDDTIIINESNIFLESKWTTCLFECSTSNARQCDNAWSVAIGWLQKERSQKGIDGGKEAWARDSTFGFVWIVRLDHVDSKAFGGTVYVERLRETHLVRIQTDWFPSKMFLGKILDKILWQDKILNFILPRILPMILGKNPAFLVKIPAFLAKIPTFRGKKPAFLVKIPAFVVKIPTFLGKIPAFLGKILTPSIHMINLYSKQG
ncbi:hypothetical protein EMCRGX_G003511 [Ephydatia muelleri]